MKAKTSTSPLLAFPKKFSRSISFSESNYSIEANESLMKELGRLQGEVEELRALLKKFNKVIQRCIGCKEKIKKMKILIPEEYSPPSRKKRDIDLSVVGKSKSFDTQHFFPEVKPEAPNIEMIKNEEDGINKAQNMKYSDYARNAFKSYKSSSEKQLKKRTKSQTSDHSITLNSEYHSASTLETTTPNRGILRCLLKREKLRALSTNEELNTKKALQMLKYTPIMNQSASLSDQEFTKIIKEQFERAPDELILMTNSNSLIRKDGGNIYNWGDFFLSNEEEIVESCQRVLKYEKNKFSTPETPLFAIDDEIGNSATFVACGANTTVILTDQGVTIKSHRLLSSPVCVGIPNYSQVNDTIFTLQTKYILGRKIIKVACGPFHFAAVTNSNEVILWGENRALNNHNYNNSINNNCIEDISFQTLPKVVRGISGTVLDIACGMHHTVAVSSFGIFTQGSNAFGQLGREGNEDQFEIVSGLLNDEKEPCEIATVACGMYHTVALTKCKKLFIWGKNQGFIAYQDFEYIFRIPVAVKQFEEVLNVACGYNHTVILSSDGVYACGSTLFGKLGIGFTRKEYLYFERLNLNILEIDHLSCGPHSSFAIKKNGEVYTWGFLTNITKSDHQYTPRLMAEISSRNLFIKTVAAGASHACFLSDKKASNCYSLYLKACQISDQLISIRRLKGGVPQNNSTMKYIQDRVMDRFKISDPQSPTITVNRAHISYTFASSEENKTTQEITITNTSNQDIEVVSFIPRNEEQQLKYTHIGVQPNSLLLLKNASATVQINLRQDVQKEVKLFFCFQIKNVNSNDIGKSIKYFIYLHLIPFFGSIDEDRKGLFKTTEKSNDAIILSQLASHVPQEILFRLCLGIPSEPSVCTLKSAVLLLDISGFTSLTSQLSIERKSGGERITQHLNSYFSTLISVVNQHGGDIAKFVGDAMICLFNNEPNFTDTPDPLDILLLRAVNCALKIQENYAEYDGDGVKLTLHIAVGAGELSSMIVGGINKTWHYFITGPAISSLNSALKCSVGGEVIVSGKSFHLIERYCEAEMVDSDFKVNKVNVVPELRMLPPFYLPPGTELASRSIIPYFVQNAYERGALVDELRRATVLFIKLSNIEYTNSASKNCKLVNEFVEVIQKEIYKQEGTIIQFFEDEKGTLILASFGLPPLSHEDDAIRAINAAIGVHSSLKEINIDSAIGVTTGDLFCGLVGSQTRKEYTIISNSVNLASRLTEIISNLGGGIICDEPTRDACYPRLQFDKLEPVFVKGNSNPIQVYKPDPNTLRSPAYLRTLTPTIVGRSKLLTKIKSNLMELMKGKSSWVTVITGAEGMGKTTICSYAAQLARDFGISIAHGDSDPIQRSHPFYIWKKILLQILGMEFSEEFSKENVEELSAKLGCEAKFLPLFNNLLPIQLKSNIDANNLHPSARNSLIVRLLTRLIEKKSKESPLLIILENLHWVDSLSLSLASNIAKLDTPVLLFVTTRPIQEAEEEKFHDFYSSPNIRHYNLSPLSAQQCENLAINLFHIKSKDPTPPAITAILSISKGNPLFVIALLLGFSDSKLIDVDKLGNWVISPDLKITEISCSIENAINARLDCLAPGTRDILKISSVIGKDFEVSVLNHLVDEKEANLHEKLNTLTSLDILFQQKKNIYSFKNEIVLKIVYSRLPFSQRKNLHEKLASYYENFPSLPKNNLLIAHHWDQAIKASESLSYDTISKCIKYMRLASDMASRFLISSDASYWFERSLELVNISSENIAENANNQNMKKLRLQVMGMPLKGYTKFPREIM